MCFGSLKLVLTSTHLVMAWKPAATGIKYIYNYEWYNSFLHLFTFQALHDSIKIKIIGSENSDELCHHTPHYINDDKTFNKIALLHVHFKSGNGLETSAEATGINTFIIMNDITHAKLLAVKIQMNNFITLVRVQFKKYTSELWRNDCSHCPRCLMSRGGTQGDGNLNIGPKIRR